MFLQQNRFLLECEYNIRVESYIVKIRDYCNSVSEAIKKDTGLKYFWIISCDYAITVLTRKMFAKFYTKCRAININAFSLIIAIIMHISMNGWLISQVPVKLIAPALCCLAAILIQFWVDR